MTNLQIAASVTTVIGLCSVFGYLYLQLALKHKEGSLMSALDGERIVDKDHVVELLKNQTTDEGRIAMLDRILNHDTARREGFLQKVSVRDIKGFVKESNSNKRWILLIVGGMLLLFSAIAFISQRQPSESPVAAKNNQTLSRPEDSVHRPTPKPPIISVILGQERQAHLEDYLASLGVPCDLVISITTTGQSKKKMANDNWYFEGGVLTLKNKGVGKFTARLEKIGHNTPMSEEAVRNQLNNTIVELCVRYFREHQNSKDLCVG
jgi:hypothetical protein